MNVYKPWSLILISNVSVTSGVHSLEIKFETFELAENAKSKLEDWYCYIVRTEIQR